MSLEITRRADYATRLMIELGKQTDQTWVSAEKLRQETGVPKPFLHKITADLVRADLVKTFPGPTGGLALARPQNKINLLQILEAIDGAICINVCQLRPQECPRDRICPAHTVWGDLQMTISRKLQSVSLADLVKQANYLKKHPRPLKANVKFSLG